ncbi:MAG: VanZ family protein [Eubacteriales bacterium]|nr:VanZ family protein [Eubacteriales bacterium]
MIRKIFLYIYGCNLYVLSALMLLFLLLWTLFTVRYSGRRLWRSVNILIFAVTLSYALCLTLLARSRGEYGVSFDLIGKWMYIKEHLDSRREVVMNAVLFFPLGLSFSQLIYRGNAEKTFRNTVLSALFLSFCIEFLQYVLSSGTAEISDLLLNTSGAAIGALPVLIAGKIKNHS